MSRWRAGPATTCVVLAVFALPSHAERSVEPPGPAPARSAVEPAGQRPSPKPVTRPQRATTQAPGVAAWDTPGTALGLRRSKAAWVYDWSAEPEFEVPTPTQFVPMIWDGAAATAETLAIAETHGPELLGFNEPDRWNQANMTVEEALDVWPALESTGLRLGSPAVATGAPDPGGWLDRFMRRAEARRYRVDFIAAHWYGSGDFRPAVATEELRNYLTAIHDRYRKPVWLTEYALLGFAADETPIYPSPAAQARFLRTSTRMLDSLPWLERYAWFALPAPESGPSTGMFRPDGSPTANGTAFRSAMRATRRR